MSRKTTVLPVLAPATALRKASKLSAAALAEKLGCSRANVFQTERRGGGISVATLWDWADTMGLELKIVAYPKRTEPSALAVNRERVSAELAADDLSSTIDRYVSYTTCAMVLQSVSSDHEDAKRDRHDPRRPRHRLR